MKKGQVLIMTAVLISLVVVGIRIEFDSLQELELETGGGQDAAQLLENVHAEMKTSSGLAFTEANNATYVDDRLANFTSFVREREDLLTLYSITGFRPSDTLRVRVHNFLDQNLEDVSVAHNLTGSSTSSSIGSLDVGEAGSISSTHSPSSQIPVQVNVSYTRKGTGEREKLRYIALAGPSLNYTTAGISLSIRSGETVLGDASVTHLSSNSTTGETSKRITPCEGCIAATSLPGI